MPVLDLQPLLSDSRIVLRPLAEPDFEPLYAAASDPLIWEQHPSRDRYRRDVFAGYFSTGLESRGALLVSDALSGAVIGCSRYYDYEPAAGRVKIGYTFLARAYWGGSYNGSLKRLMLAHAFAAVQTVDFEVGEGNLRSRRAVERLGAVLIDRRAIASPGETSATGKLLYRLTAEVWSLRGAQETPAAR